MILKTLLADASFPGSSLRDLRQQLRWEEFVFTPAGTGIRIGDHGALVRSTAKWTDGGFY
jgi:hypothetical protein